MTNCPNCGAVITGPQCEYCETRFEPYLLLPMPSERLRKLLEDKPGITYFMTPNEIRQLVGLEPRNELSDLRIVSAETIKFMRRFD